MAGFPCPYCAQELGTRAQDDNPSGPSSLESCPSCAASLQIAYRYRIVAERGKISSGVLYEAVDDIFGDKVAVLFVEKKDDPAAVERFIRGHRMFADLGGGRGLVKVREIGTIHDRRPHVVIDWIAQGTLEQTIRANGPLDQATLLELISDLLIGLSKAHRAMPTVVHGHIHPGKIGFLDKHRVVLFGFEWAEQVYEQDSHLADSFIGQIERTTSASRASDLQQLGVAIFYAATGEWIADKPLEQQRARVQQLGGPVPAVIDRMLTADGEGYRSAVDALLDFEHLLEGTSTWKSRPRPRQQDLSRDLVAVPWTSEAPAASVAPTEGWDEHDDDEHDDGEHDDDQHHDEPQDFDEAIADIFESETEQPARPPVSPPPRAFPAGARVDRRALHAKPAPAKPAPAKPAKSPGKVIAITIGSIFAFGMCVSAIIEDNNTSTPPPPPTFRSPEPIPVPPMQLPEVIEAVPPMPSDGFTMAEHRTGTITGPANIAGFEVGERCDVWIEPNVGGLNCRWYIDCGEPRRRIYGGGSVGYSSCTIENGSPTEAQDEQQDAADGAFVALLSGDDPMVLVEDRWLLPPTRVMIGIDAGGGPWAASVPDVPLAERTDRNLIEDALARNALPEFPDTAEQLPDKLSGNQIRKILESRAGELRSCEIEGDPILKIHLSLLSDGRVEDVEVTPEIEPNAKMCLTSVLIGTRFPAFSGPSMKFTWTFRP
jgi:serine/threonine protein kinase